MPPRLKDRGSSWHLSLIEFLTTHHAEGNSMASPTQMVVGKGIPNLLIAEGLLKILRDLLSLSPPKSLTNSRPWNGKTSKEVVIVLSVK